MRHIGRHPTVLTTWRTYLNNDRRVSTLDTVVVVTIVERGVLLESSVAVAFVSLLFDGTLKLLCRTIITRDERGMTEKCLCVRARLSVEKGMTRRSNDENDLSISIISPPMIDSAGKNMLMNA